MAAPANGQEFFELLEKSQLLDAELISKLRPQMAQHQQTEPKRLATTLLKNQLITEYQAKQLLVGKYKGFYLARYKILELLGVGGMGRVYLSEQLSMERLVAIKLISLHKNKKLHAQALARFKREAKAVATLRHPNIIQAFDFAEEHGMPYIVMEYVEGLDTAKIVQKFGPIPWKQAAEYGRQAAEGLEHAHKAGLVHRDIKPGNLLVDSSGQVKILDLGLVSAFDQKTDDSLTVDQDQLGTVDYIAPEQAIDSKNVDARADLYSLGATLYSVMTGRILFPDKSTAQKLLMHQTTDPEPIANLVKGIPPELAAVIAKMLAKKPEQRFQSAQEVAAALKTFAEPKSPPYELNAVKYRRSVYEGFLGKSPEPNQITVPTLGSPEVDKPTASSTDGASSSMGKLRQTSMISAGSSEAVLDEFTMSGDDYTQLAMEMPSLVRGKKKKKIKKKTGLSTGEIVAVAGSLLGLLLAAWLGSSALRALGKTDEPYTQPLPNPPAITATTTAPAPLLAKPQNPTDAALYQTIELANVANTTTSKGMFNEKSNLTETLVFDNWGPKTVENVPFSLIDPQNGQTPNAIMLHGTSGTQPPQKPRNVTVLLNTAAKAVHLLSGVGGYCYPTTREPVTTLVAKLKYADGQTEEHRFVNGTHFADYIRREDVPGSIHAFNLQEKQLRYLWLIPQQTKVIESIEFVKDSENATTPLIMALTIQRPEIAPASVVAAAPYSQQHILSTELSPRPILITKETANEEAWRGDLFKALSDPELLVCYTFDESSISGNKVSNLARSTLGKFDLKLVGPKVSAGRFPGKKSIRFNPAGVTHRAEISPADSEQLQLEDRFTIAIWFKIDKFDKMWQTLIAKGDSGWRVHRNHETNRLALHISTADNKIYELNGSYLVNDTRWHQIVCVNSPQTNSMKIYMDGFLDIEMPWTVHSGKNPFPVWLGEGSEPGKGNRGFDGWIDEIAIWKRDLDAVEVKRMFTQGNPEQ